MKGRKLNYQVLLFIGIAMLTFRCIEPYNPPAINQVIDMLVVDGFMNTTDSTAVVKLSKAIALSDSGDPSPEKNALVRIEDEAGKIFSLTEINDGEYSGQNLSFNPNLKHRLLITSNTQDEFASDFIELKVCPPIDSITWRSNNRTPGLDILVNTHDATAETQYYQWTFEETWEYTAGYPSSFKIQNYQVIPLDQNIFQCWASQASTEILVYSTTPLQSDLVRDFELTFIPFLSQKTRRKYSIEVEQRALTKDAYDFHLQLKKTTENLGSLFDPLPSQVLGNLKNIKDHSKPVLGYFSGGSIAKKRIFVAFNELPLELQHIEPRYCPLDTIDIELIPTSPDMTLVQPVYFGPSIIGYYVSYGAGCMDCRDLGGHTTRPDFWE